MEVPATGDGVGVELLGEGLDLFFHLPMFGLSEAVGF